MSRWEEERRGFFEVLGYRREEIGRLRREGRDGFKEVEMKHKEIQVMKRRERIRMSRYNKWYKMIISESLPQYLIKGWGESRWQRVARFKTGGVVR